MMGWAMLLAFALFAAGLLAVLRFPRTLWMVAATALTLGATGYAWQGNPGLAGNPVTHEKDQKGDVDPELVTMREAVFGRFNLESAYFGRADAMTRVGAKDSAVRAMLGAVGQVPDDGALWTWLGMTLADASGGIVTQPAELAFQRAMTLWPKHSGPPYFYAQALGRGGRVLEARAYLAKAVALAPPNQAYHDVMAGELAGLDAYIAKNGGPPVPGQ